MDFETIVKSRYAAKKFDGKTVPEETMQKLYELIRLAPSSFNLQPWKIRVVTDAAAKEKLRAVSWNQEQITTCSHLLVFCADTDLEARLDAVKASMQKASVPVGDIEGYANMVGPFVAQMAPEQRKFWAQRQVYLAAENALLGAKSLGLDSCPMEGFDAAKYSEMLELPAHLAPTVLVPIGHAADTPHAKVRLGREEIFF